MNEDAYTAQLARQRRIDVADGDTDRYEETDNEIAMEE